MASHPSLKTVLITGCSPGGIGNALAREFHSRGCRVIATARRQEALVDLAGLGMTTALLDVNSQESINAISKKIEELANGKLDILVNNAGISYMMPLTDVSLDRVRAIFETNVFSVMALTKSLMPQLIVAQGLVVNISSASECVPFPFKGSYAMTKAALASYSRTLSVEVAEYGVRVLNVTTAYVSSLLNKRNAPDPWPRDSLFDSMKKVAFSVGSERRMSTENYAKYVVSEALRGKGWEIGPWRFFGTRETIMIGTFSTPLWILSFLGSNWARFFMLRIAFKFSALRDALRKKRT